MRALNRTAGNVASALPSKETSQVRKTYMTTQRPSLRIAFVTLKAETVASYGLMYLSSSLKAAGHRTELWSVEDGSELRGRLSHGAPEILAYGVTTGLHKVYLEINREAKA
ncbi:MAG: hypothetical protein NT090_01090, partial [Acidobacteria bacterium]|nr:hypothetical protein [Acidobacteriota bacterium]